MVGELITLPLRVGVRATQLWLRLTGEALGLAVQLTERALDRGRGDRDYGEAPTTPGDSAFAPGPPAPLVSEPAPVAEPAPTAEPTPAPDPTPRPAAAERRPWHVSEEPVLTEELSEPGAEEGAGAEVHVREPWEGYERASAKQIIARLGRANPAELAAVQLYERGRRGRQTVLAAVERQLRATNGGGSPNSERNR